MVELLRGSGHEVVTAGEPDTGIDAIVADLDAVEIERVGRMGPPKLGFCSHTDTGTRDAAERAGFDRVVPRSRMARELPDLVSALLA